MTATRMHRIVLAEDHALLRDGLRSLLSREPGIEIVGEARDGMEAVALVRRLKPDLVLMDLTMPKLSGLDAIREIAKRHPGTKAIALTMHDTEEYVLATLRAGASGYVLKQANSSELIEAIHAVLCGKTYVSEVIRRTIPSGACQGGGAATPWDTVTTREREILKLIAEGHISRQIADLLSISVKTVQKHRSNLMCKLDLHNSAALTSLALKKGLID
jgi:DNA-binding NarL/FixJ family response regulator